MSADSIAKQKSKAFAIRIVKLYQFLMNEKKEFEMCIRDRSTTVSALPTSR